MVYRYVLSREGMAYMSYVSARGYDIYEITPEDLAKNPGLIPEMVHPEDQPGLREAVQESAETLNWFEWEGRIITKTGKIRWVKARSAPERSPKGDTRWDGLLIDVTEDKKTQEELLKTQEITAHREKLASIGSWLQEWVTKSTTLAICSGNLSILKREIPDSLEVLSRIQKMEIAGRRITEIVDLFALSPGKRQR